MGAAEAVQSEGAIAINHEYKINESTYSTSLDVELAGEDKNKNRKLKEFPRARVKIPQNPD